MLLYLREVLPNLIYWSTDSLAGPKAERRQMSWMPTRYQRPRTRLGCARFSAPSAVHAPSRRAMITAAKAQSVQRRRNADEDCNCMVSFSGQIGGRAGLIRHGHCHCML